MVSPSLPDVVVDICHQCVPAAESLPRQWTQDGALVVTHELPCSGKIDVQYLMHVLGEVRGGLCVVACPRGSCRLAQGNLRAEVRIATLRKLLGEIGLEPERAELLHFDREATPDGLLASVRGAVTRLTALGPNPVLAAAPISRRTHPVAAAPVALPRVAGAHRGEPAPAPMVAGDCSGE